MSAFGSCFACGKSFSSAIEEDKHRHNFPALCTHNKKFREWEAEVELRKLQALDAARGEKP